MTDLSAENQWSSVGRPTTDRLRLEMTVERRKNPTFPFFTWRSNNNNRKERLDLNTFYKN